MLRRLLPLLPVVAIVAGCSAGTAQSGAEANRRAAETAKQAADLDKALAGLKPGPPQQCVNQFSLRSTSTEAHGKTLLYRQSSSLVYRTDTSGGCFGLDRGDTIVSKSFSGQLCSGDIIQTVEPVSGTFTGSCTLGPFTRYTKSGS